jgi:ABC transporter DrrB family efflux protein
VIVPRWFNVCQRSTSRPYRRELAPGRTLNLQELATQNANAQARIRPPALALRDFGGVAIAEDLKSGMIDRFCSLPMARPAVLAGRSLTDLARSIISLAVMVGLGVAVGFRFHSDASRILAGMLLILAFGYTFSWMNAAIGISAGDPESGQNAATGPTFLLLFASNAIVPASTLPGWLQPFARNQPLGVTTSAIRELFEGAPAAHDAWVSLAWSAGITVVFFLTSYALYQRAAAR